MATGDVDNFVSRLEQVIPPWFGEKYPLLSAFLTGFASMESFLYGLLQYVQEQVVIQTATGNNLDLVCCDYFEGLFERYPQMSDTQFRVLIQATLLEPLCTRQAMENAIYNLTGYYPKIYEPFQTEGNAFLDSVSFLDAGSFVGGSDPYNFWIEVFVQSPTVSGSAFVDGSSSFVDGPAGTLSFVGSNSTTVLTYDQVLAVINRVKVGGTVPHLTLTFV
jgi:hypothetical protein